MLALFDLTHTINSTVACDASPGIVARNLVVKFSHAFPARKSTHNMQRFYECAMHFEMQSFAKRIRSNDFRTQCVA